jgi:hypothetical protein
MKYLSQNINMLIAKYSGLTKFIGQQGKMSWQHGESSQQYHSLGEGDRLWTFRNALEGVVIGGRWVC